VSLNLCLKKEFVSFRWVSQISSRSMSPLGLIKEFPNGPRQYSGSPSVPPLNFIVPIEALVSNPIKTKSFSFVLAMKSLSLSGIYWYWH
jgi:hypothetical protein